MDAKPRFAILIRKKIPYWNKLLFGLMTVFFIVSFLLYLVMLPSEHNSEEIKVAYYILAVPEWLKKASAFSIFGLVLLIPVYKLSKRRVPALLFIEDDGIRIAEKKNERTIRLETITKIMVNDIKRLFGDRATEVVIKQGSAVSTSFLLKSYEQTDVLIEAFSIYDKVEFVFYDGMAAIEAHDED